jgi:hypothetical protein
LESCTCKVFGLGNGKMEVLLSGMIKFIVGLLEMSEVLFFCHLNSLKCLRIISGDIKQAANHRSMKLRGV